MTNERFRFSLVPKELSWEEISGISDPHERRFGLMAYESGLSVSDGGFIKLNRKKKNKEDKLSTNPDFLVNDVFVEITSGNNLGSRKAGQKRVMDEAGLPYVQITGREIDDLEKVLNLKKAILAILIGE